MSTRITAKHAVCLITLLVLSGVGVTTLLAQEMSTEIYGNHKLGEETTVKQSLEDPHFKLRKLDKDHYLYFEQPTPSAAEVSQMKALKAKSWTVPITAMEMKLIPPGEFVMGSPESERYRRKNEVQHRVKISRPFYMGIFEVTQRQFYYLTIPDYNFFAWKFEEGPIHVGGAYRHRNGIKWGDWFKEHLEYLPDNPMETFSWITAVKYCRRLTEFERQAGRLPEGYEYRLPTEAEWEYACRAGSTSYFNTGADLDTLIARSSKGRRGLGDAFEASLLDLGMFAFNGGKSGKISEKRIPNAFGLYDMHGNVCEYTLDTYAPYKTDEGVQVDPVNFENEPDQDVFVDEKVIRGGCWLSKFPTLKKGETKPEVEKRYSLDLRSAARNSISFDFDFNIVTKL